MKVEKKESMSGVNSDNLSKKQKFNLGDVVYMVTKPKLYSPAIRLASIDKQ